VRRGYCLVDHACLVRRHEIGSLVLRRAVWRRFGKSARKSRKNRGAARNAWRLETRSPTALRRSLAAVQTRRKTGVLPVALWTAALSPTGSMRRTHCGSER
jgi:hypothetical protein